MTFCTHSAPEIARAIPQRRNNRLVAKSNRAPLPRIEIHLPDWRNLISLWSIRFPGAIS